MLFETVSLQTGSSLGKKPIHPEISANQSEPNLKRSTEEGMKAYVALTIELLRSQHLSA